ncbi:MAG: HAD-IC family P-type ATPase, partial [Oscillospiraceae bacterium]|nr:HAD-IC family P-type ATPase [Oscillospiraceae bacterium]
MESQVLSIRGMTCAACSARIERMVGKLPGVDKISVNLASERASLTFDGGVVTLGDIIARIEKLGYGAAVPKAKQEDEERLRRQKEVRTLKIKLLVSAVFSLPLLYIAMAPMIKFVALPFPDVLNPMLFPLRYALTELLLTLPVIGVGWRFYYVGYRALWMRSPNMDSLIAVGTTAAVVFSAYNTWRIAFGGMHAAMEAAESLYLYYETAGVIITLILLGKTLEAVSKGRTSEAIKKLMGLAPKTAIVVRDGAEREIPIDEVEIGDTLVVKPGAKIPVDGTVLDGHTAIDESMLTGESMPVDKKAGDPVYAASLNTTGAVRFRAEKIGADTALAQIIKLVEDAQGTKAPIAKLADVVSGYFVPTVCLIALIAGVAWFIGTRDLAFSLTIFISVLVIACPCALGLATP